MTEQRCENETPVDETVLQEARAIVADFVQYTDEKVIEACKVIEKGGDPSEVKDCRRLRMVLEDHNPSGLPRR